MSERPVAEPRHAYPFFTRITTRWMDNDAYGHVNNVVYYSFFDTVVNAWLIERGALDVENGDVIGFVVETGCHYFAPLSYPETVTAARVLPSASYSTRPGDPSASTVNHARRRPRRSARSSPGDPSADTARVARVVPS